MKRSITALLLCTLLANLMASCQTSDTPAGTEPVGTDDTTAAGTSAETDRSQLQDNLPAADFNDYVFRIIGRSDNFMYEAELGTDEQMGDVVNDAAWSRDMTVEDRYSIEIQRHFYKSTDSQIHTLVRQSVQAGEDAYDLVINSSHETASLASQGLLLDWYGVENVDFDQPWWSSDAIAELAVNNHSYMAVSDICVSNIGIAMCIFYNKTLGEEYQLENIYEVVNSGRWTYDYFFDVVKDIHKDLNGDSIMDDNDLYGFGNNIGSTLQPFVFSLGARFSEKDENDIPQLSMNNEAFISVFEKIYNLHMNNEGVLAHGNYQVPRTKFANSQIVFNTGAVYHSATLYRDMTDEVGVLPFPKADESMEKYYTCHDPNVSVLSIPASASDPARTGLIVSALSAESYRTMVPAFYETALKVKYSRDDETVQTLDIIKDGVTFDFVVLYGSAGTAAKLGQCLSELVGQQSTDFASYYAQNAPAAEAYLNQVIDNYLALDES